MSVSATVVAMTPLWSVTKFHVRVSFIAFHHCRFSIYREPIQHEVDYSLTEAATECWSLHCCANPEGRSLPKIQIDTRNLTLTATLFERSWKLATVKQ